MSRPFRATLLIALLAAGCSDAGSPEPPMPTKLGFSTAPSATARNREPLATQPVVRLEDESGAAVAESGVSIQVTLAGGGTLAGNPIAVTDANGRATFSALEIQGVAGAKTLTFSAAGLSPVSANITATGGAPTAIALLAGDEQEEGEGIAVPVKPAVRVTDVDGNGAPSVAVTFAVETGGGAVVGAAQVTNSDGVATVGSWSLGTEGSNTLTAGAAGVGETVTFTATALRLDVASVVVTNPGTSITALTTRQLAATAYDSVGRALAGRAFTWSSAATDIATVSASGLVQGELPGSANISATSEGESGSVDVTVVAPVLVPAQPAGGVDSSLSGHVGVSVNGGAVPPAPFQYGYGYYSSIHTLNAPHESRAQLGWGSWLAPDNSTFNEPLCPVGTVARDFWSNERGPSFRDVYQTIEGGVGQWLSTRFPYAITKFRVNGTPDCYNTQVSSGAWTFGGERLAGNKLGLAQLSNRLLVPPDGLTFTTSGTVFGNAWIALPLIPAFTAPSGLAVGDQSWTLFVRAANFSGPIVFYTPELWTLVHLNDPTGRGRSHDARPLQNGNAAMEMGTLAFFTGVGPDGTRYRRIPRLTFPLTNAGLPGTGTSVLQQDLQFFSKQAIWDGIAAWIEDGTVAASFNAAGATAASISNSSFGVSIGGQPVVFPPSFTAGAVTTGGGTPAVGLQWTGDLEIGVFPEYYKETGATWTAVPVSEVPRTTWLIDQTFPLQPRGSYPRVSTSASAPFDQAMWAPGGGPFTTALADGSIVEYAWYRFVDQPAIARLNLPTEVLDKLQAFVESFHANAGTAGPSIGPPSAGTLATLDPALFVTPPAGLSLGYVPVILRQY